MDSVFSLFPEFGKQPDEKEYNCREGCHMRLFRGISKEAFSAYAQRLEASDYEKVFENTIGSVTLKTFSGDVHINLIYSANDGILRITASNDEVLPRFEPSFVSGDCDTVFYMLENDHTLIDCGMCLLVQCSDYSFFVVDSGHYYQFNDNDRIYKFMRDRTPEGQKVVISGWFITHAHSDHISKLIDFVRYNTNDVVIEAFYSNLVSNEYRKQGEDDEEYMLAQKLFDFLDSLTNIPKIKLHTGQSFYIRELKLDVLCTHEDVYPQRLSDYNDSSTVLMMTARGTRILIPGDAGALESRILEERYGDSLKCDIVQIAHHGHHGLSKRAYELISAKAALFPITRIKFDEEYPRIEANRRAIELADEYRISSDGTLEIKLPYEVGKIKKHPDETFEDFDKIKGLWGYEYTDERKRELIKLFTENGGDTSKLLLPII